MAIFVNMVLGRHFLKILTSYGLWLLLSCSLSSCTETDVACLKSIKASLEDPFNYLKSSWDFNNNTEGYICRFIGVECWHPDENKVLNLRLSDMGLKGRFPVGIQNCTSITGVDLSSNNLVGPIPDNISAIIPFVTSLDLSSNNFSGGIPKALANCTYLNILKLGHNRLSGQIPPELGFTVLKLGCPKYGYFGALTLSSCTETDVACLKSIKASLEDPFNYLKSSWDFNNSTEGYICRFTGVECWHPDENKVLNLRLSDMGLKGRFPVGIQNCTSITGVDLSSNNLDGPIPDNISAIIPFVTSLDLSSNNFSGGIPKALANCTYLNILKLDHNRLSGQIPPELGFTVMKLGRHKYGYFGALTCNR
ncbi:hypothetical protein GH714_029356 [Hevea brasiliensis]|uniref:Leucine-rich repeat-containing N-terminal plant-type domain-containing protein n=1 Tax=Hevea brasiliensis TaxID=3981 RepID=A0A6A6K9L3_HEVBR|nr:hypothetical protein GH714_029356 [Hevea brasiliensis]